MNDKGITLRLTEIELREIVLSIKYRRSYIEELAKHDKYWCNREHNSVTYLNRLIDKVNAQISDIDAIMTSSEDY